jgi:peptidoglycan/xylan/chitin deacetylase (PgdA/CDA1 family)
MSVGFSRLPRLVVAGLATAGLAAGLAVGGVAAALPAQAAGSANLMANPSAETVSRGLPKGWVKGHNGVNSAALTVGSVGAKAGKRYARVAVSRYTSGGAWWAAPAVPVRARAGYAYTESYRSTAPSSVQAAFTVGRRTVWVTLGTPAPAATWTALSYQVSAPAGATAVRFAHVLRAVGRVDVDALSVAARPVTATGAPAGSPAGSPSGSAPSTAAGPGLVSVTFDDGYADQVTNGLPVLTANKIPGTFYLISSWLGAGSFMTVEAAKKLQAAGSEIGSHTATHVNLAAAPISQVDSELATSKKELEDRFGPVTSFAYPNGAYNATVQAEVAKYFGNARTTDSGQNVKGSYNRYTMAIGYVFNTTSPATVAGWVNTAKANNAWLILCYHRIADDDPTNAYTHKIADFTAEMKAIHDSGIRSVTVRDGVALTS